MVEWNHNLDRDQKINLASAAKSVYSNILGIVAEEDKITSADTKAVDYFSEMMDFLGSRCLLRRN